MAGRLLPVLVLRRPRARGIKLAADAVQGVVRLSLPARGGVSEALGALAAHRDWLAAQVARWPVATPLAPDAMIPFDGQVLRIDWRAGNARTPQRVGDELRVGGPPEQLPGRVRRWLQATALAEMTAATHKFAARVERRVTQVRIGDPRGRWGSCATTAGRIAYSWRLIMAPGFVRTNVVAHEVAHLVHANHGPDFYACLGGLDGNTAASRRWLRAHGAGLHWVGRA